MKAYVAIKYHESNRNRTEIEVISSILQESGFESCCITRDIERWGSVGLTARDLMLVTFEIMDSCSLVVLDLTEKGVGLGIEAGYAYANGIPIITIAKAGSDISKTLRGISTNVLLYQSFVDLRSRLSITVKNIALGSPG
jgi:nucleoside 2-deoxyribosyltransferase